PAGVEPAPFVRTLFLHLQKRRNQWGFAGACKGENEIRPSDLTEDRDGAEDMGKKRPDLQYQRPRSNLPILELCWPLWARADFEESVTSDMDSSQPAGLVCIYVDICVCTEYTPYPAPVMRAVTMGVGHRDASTVAGQC